MSTPSSITPPIDLTRVFTLESGRNQPADPAKVAQLAQEFEAMLMLQMVRQMRQSLLSEEDQESGFGNETMTETLDVEFARYLAKAGGIGLAKEVARHIRKAEGETASTEDARPTPAGSLGREPGATIGVPRAGESTPRETGAAPAMSSVPVREGASIPRDTPSSRPLHEGEGSASASDLALPMSEDSQSSSFGWRRDPFHGRRRFHSGVDFRAAYGTDVPTAGAGTVTFAGERGGYGLMVVVQHPGGVETRYAHLSASTVQSGDRLDQGQVVGRVGSSGRSTGPHLHFEVLVDGRRVDPEQVVDLRSGEFKFVRASADSPPERMVLRHIGVSETGGTGGNHEDPGRSAR